MQLMIEVVGDPGDETRLLRNWLADEVMVRRFGQMRPAAKPVPGGMGTLEAITMLVGSGLTLTQLLTYIVTWRAARPKPVLVRVQAGGRSVEVRTNDLADVAFIARQLTKSLADDPEES